MWVIDTPFEAVAPTVPTIRPFSPNCSRYETDLDAAIDRILRGRNPSDLGCQQGDTTGDCAMACTILGVYRNFASQCGRRLATRISELNSQFQCWYIF